jgi:hypothetical protein
MRVKLRLNWSDIRVLFAIYLILELIDCYMLTSVMHTVDTAEERSIYRNIISYHTSGYGSITAAIMKLYFSTTRLSEGVYRRITNQERLAFFQKIAMQAEHDETTLDLAAQNRIRSNLFNAMKKFNALKEVVKQPAVSNTPLQVKATSTLDKEERKKNDTERAMKKPKYPLIKHARYKYYNCFKQYS